MYYVMSKTKMAITLYMDRVKIFLKRIKFTKRQKNRDMNMLPFGAIS